MAKNTIDDLRNHLFDTLQALKDPDKPMELERAKTVADVAKVIVESAKVEVDFLKVTGGVNSTGFLPDAADGPALAPARPGPRALLPARTAAANAATSRERDVLTFLRDGSATLESIRASLYPNAKSAADREREQDALVVTLEQLVARHAITRAGDTYMLAAAAVGA